MKKVLLTILGIIIVLGTLAGTGFAGYQIGYRLGALAHTNGNPVPFTREFRFGPDDMPMHNFGRDLDRGFNRGFRPGGFVIMGRGMGFGFLFPLMFLGHVVFWGLVVWFAYWLFTRSGWQLARRSVESPKVDVSESGKKTE